MALTRSASSATSDTLRCGRPVRRGASSRGFRPRARRAPRSLPSCASYRAPRSTDGTGGRAGVFPGACFARLPGRPLARLPWPLAPWPIPGLPVVSPAEGFCVCANGHLFVYFYICGDIHKKHKQGLRLKRVLVCMKKKSLRERRQRSPLLLKKDVFPETKKLRERRRSPFAFKKGPEITESNTTRKKFSFRRAWPARTEPMDRASDSPVRTGMLVQPLNPNAYYQG